MVFERVTRACEAVRDGIAQPVNSWTSLIFFGAAALFLLYYTNKSQKFIHNNPLYSYLYIFIVALIGASSFWAHATVGLWGGTADFSSIYLLVTLTILLGISWLKPMKPSVLLTIWVLINIPLVYVASLSGRVTDYTLMALVFLIIIFELIAHKRSQAMKAYQFWLALLMLAIGYGLWQLDNRGIWCDPYGIWQGHGFWHLFAALAAGILYVYLVNKPSRTTLSADVGNRKN
jgi:hypothetical protein